MAKLESGRNRILRGNMKKASQIFWFALCWMLVAAPALNAQKKPNIVFIMGDDIGWSNIGAYDQGIMAGRTPNLDRMAAEGMRFTDYYAEASCTAGRANFITGEIPLRTGLSRPGGLVDWYARPGSDHSYSVEVDGVRHWPVRQEPSG